MKSSKFTFRALLLAAICMTIMGHSLTAQELADKEGKIRKKVFIFTYNEEVTAAQIDSVKADFLSLPALVDGMISAEWGKDSENNQKHCLILTFTSDEAHERYVNHPIHQGLGPKFGHLFEGGEMVGAYFWTEP